LASGWCYLGQTEADGRKRERQEQDEGNKQKMGMGSDLKRQDLESERGCRGGYRETGTSVWWRMKKEKREM